MDLSDAQSRSRPARRRRHHRRALHAADAADPARRIGRPDRQGAAGDDRARLCDVVLGRRPGAERDHPHLRLRSQCAAHRRGHPAARLRTADDLAGAVRMAVDPDQRAVGGSATAACSRQGNDRRLRARHHARPGLDALRRPGAGLDPDRGRDLEGHRMGEPAAGGLRHRRGDPDAGDRLWRPGRHHPRPQHRADLAAGCSRASASS